MSITYNLDIPDGPNNPSNDQPKMKTNTNAINSWTSIDHVEFIADPAGTHKQVTYSSKNVPPAQTDPQSVLYTDDGTASTVSELYFRNALGASGILLISGVKAFANFTTTLAAAPVVVTLNNGYNIVSITKTSVSPVTYVIALTPGIIVGTDVIVFITISPMVSGGLPLTYTYSYAVDTLTITMSANTQNVFVNVQVLQA